MTLSAATTEDRTDQCEYIVPVSGPVLDEQASMQEMIEAVWSLPRDIISDGYDAALSILADVVPMQIHEYPTGTECFTWTIPEKWTCDEAYLETLSGQRLFCYADNPLHVVSYSLPFEGAVSRQELFAHLHTHPKIPEAVPFVFKYYKRDWGLCCSRNLKNELQEDRYRVVIKSRFTAGTLKVGEVIVPGETEDCVVLCAHLCHPAMVNDGLSGVAVGLEVLRELLKRRGLRYTYRLLIVPETIGSLAYLSRNEHLIPKMKAGLFLEALGLENPHALQLSHYGDTAADLCFRLALDEHDPDSWTAPSWGVICNDERQFNAPGIRVPMLSLSRVRHRSEPDGPYREYHSSHDTPAIVSYASLSDSAQVVLEMLETFEADQLPLNKFKGEIFCSGYDIDFDFANDPEDSMLLFEVMFQTDGTLTIAQIAAKTGRPFAKVKRIIDQFHRHGLVDYVQAQAESSL